MSIAQPILDLSTQLTTMFYLIGYAVAIAAAVGFALTIFSSLMEASHR